MGSEEQNVEIVITSALSGFRKGRNGGRRRGTGIRARDSEQQSLLNLSFHTTQRIQKTTNPAGKEKHTRYD